MIITKAPLRVSFLGGGTDYPEYFVEEGGAVLATAINRYVYINANQFASKLFDHSIRISYRKTEMVGGLDEIEHIPFRESLRHCGIEKDIEVGHFADLPAFTGLGSSSAFTVCLLQALHAFCGRHRSGLDLAYEAIRLERHVFKDCVGCQDQVLAAVGGLNFIEFRAEDNIVVHRLSLSPTRIQELENHLVLFFSGLRRSASEVAQKQVRRVNENRGALREMRVLAERGWNILEGGRPLADFGELLDHAWKLKRSLDDGVSSPEIDRLYDNARVAGALGGKLLGAGGGGFLLLYVPPERLPKVRAALNGSAVELHVSLAAPGSHIVYSDGAAQAVPELAFAEHA
ncbi:MAG: galactokinase [Candidatus Korobacteraceae bacterium]|jgi:D-glycero-alpha-D-manno-heptose-7-phosphate kinase